MTERPGTIRLPARDIAVPSTISPQAQAVLASPPSERAEYPALDDAAGSTRSPRQPRRRADPARPRGGPAAPGRGGADDAGRRPHGGRRFPSDQPRPRPPHPRQRETVVPALLGRPRPQPPPPIAAQRRLHPGFPARHPHHRHPRHAAVRHRAPAPGPARVGIPAELHVTEAGGHGGFLGQAPEDQEILAEVRRFAETHWAS